MRRMSTGLVLWKSQTRPARKPARSFSRISRRGDLTDAQFDLLMRLAVKAAGVSQ